MPGVWLARSLVRKSKKHTSKYTTGSPKRSGIPCAMVYGFLRALPGDRAFLSPSSTESRPPI